MISIGSLKLMSYGGERRFGLLDLVASIQKLPPNKPEARRPFEVVLGHVKKEKEQKNIQKG